MGKGKQWLARLENSRFAPLIQLMKFGLVGVSNTLISYAVEMLGYYVLFSGSSFPGTVALMGRIGLSVTGEQVRVMVVTALAFVISVTNAYYWNNRYVFTQAAKTAREHAWAYVKTASCYALTGLILAPVAKLWLVNIGVPYWMASLSTLIITIPLNFVMNKFWAFAGRK
ncbi:MAG: GtrA family protein [Aristaeellaceae bacterium]